MKYKLVATDMDGTLLNTKGEVSNRNKKILSKAMEQGIHIVLSTGRILKSVLQHSNHIGTSSPIIACNGAMITSKDGNEIIYENAIEHSSFQDIIRLAEENNIYYHFYNKDAFYYKKTDNDMLRYYKFYEKMFKNNEIILKGFQDPSDISNHKKSKAYKFVFIEDDTDKLLGFREKLNTIEKINISSSWDNNIEVMNEGVSKGNSLKHLIDILNIDKSQVVAIGDNENDISMFEVAGLAIAMENGDEIIREYTDVVTDTNDQDGLANAIEKYVLNK